MVTSGIDRIFISVRDMDESLAFYRDIVGMTLVAEQELNAETIQHLWNLPEGTKAKAVFLKNEDQPTLLELIQFDPHSGKFIRGGAKTWDYGIYDIAFTVKDLNKTYEQLTGRGFTFLIPPVPYSPTFFPDFHVKFSVCLGPNEMPIPHIQAITPPPPEMKREYGKIMDSAQIVENMEDALRFYHGLLGLSVVTDATFPKGLLDKILGLPEGTEGRIALLNKEGSEAPFLELIQLSVKGKFLSEVARPPNLGIFMVSFETDNLSGLTETLKKEGISILAGPVELALLPYGEARLIYVEGPSKVKIEFFERQAL
jgi:catechol 2,3-dioxygenase-like lactoylglutathione lyase family enzyme